MVCNYRQGVGGISGQVDLTVRHLLAEGHDADIFSTKGTLFWRLGLLYRLHRVAKGYDVLHVHCCSGWGFLPAVVGITIGRRLKKRTVLTYHGGGAESFFERHRRFVERYLSRTDENIVLSGFLDMVFNKYNIRHTVIPNIVELDENQFRLRKEICPHYICTRAHEELYNIPCILRAFGKVRSQLPDATLTLVGDGSIHDALVRQAPHGVVFTGRVPNDEIYRQLDLADIMLSAPRVDNMPVSLLEAMNAGLLVVSSCVGGVPYMIADGQTGLLFESDDSDQLATLMLRAVQHQDESLNIIEQAHKAVNAYRWESVRTKVYTAYGILS